MFQSKLFSSQKQKCGLEKLHQMNGLEKMELVRRKKNRDCSSLLSKYLCLPSTHVFVDLHNLQDFCFYMGMKRGFTISMEEIKRVREFIQISKEMFETIEDCYTLISPKDKETIFSQNSLSNINSFVVESFHTTVYAFMILHQDIDRFIVDVRNKYHNTNVTPYSKAPDNEQVQIKVALSHPKYLLILRKLFLEEKLKSGAYLNRCQLTTLSEFVEFLVYLVLYPNFYYLQVEHEVALHQLKLGSKTQSFPTEPLKKDWFQRFYNFLEQIQECDELFFNSSINSTLR